MTTIEWLKGSRFTACPSSDGEIAVVDVYHGTTLVRIEEIVSWSDILLIETCIDPDTSRHMKPILRLSGSDTDEAPALGHGAGFEVFEPIPERDISYERWPVGNIRRRC